MDRLVKVDVKEVIITYKRGLKSNKASFKLTNLMHTMPVAVSLTTSNPSVFSFSESFSIIPPLSSSSYTLILLQSSPDQLQSLLSNTPNVVNVKSSMLPTGKAQVEELQRLFSRPGPHVFRDATTPISLVGPEVVEFLVSNQGKFRDLSSYFNRAARGCTKSQLTELLKAAVISGDECLVKSLIDQGGDVNCKDTKGRSLISLAIKACKFDVVKVLIDSGCVVNESVDQVLHDAAASNRGDLMEILCSNFKNLDVNSADSHGRTPIHVAANKGYAEIVNFCVSIGGKTNVFDTIGMSPLHLAAEKGHLETVEILLNHSNFVKYAVNKQGKTAYAIAVDNENSNLYEILQVGDSLHAAARRGDVEAIKSCIQQGVNVNGRDQNGWTPLHRAAFKGGIESVKLLINHGALVNAVDDNGYMPLHCAMEAGNLQVALLLIAHDDAKEVNLKSSSFRFKSFLPWSNFVGCFKSQLLLGDCVVKKKKCD